MSHVGSLSLDEAPRLPSRTRQFLAIMLKNVLLQIRSKKVCGIRCSGFFAVVMDMLVPVAFIAVMCLVRELKDVDTKPRLFKEIPLRSTDWEFPHIDRGHEKLIFAPRNSRTEAVSALVAKALACSPPDHDHGSPIPGQTDNFGPNWSAGLPRKCKNPEVCETSDDCYAAVQRHRFVWAEPGDVTALAVGNPGQFTAAIIFEMPHSETAPVDSFKLHVNHTAMPSSLAKFSDISVGSVTLSALPNEDWKKYYWTANLQHSVERSLIALHLDGPDAPRPTDISVSVKGMPWPSQHLNIGGSIAGMLLIFMLVFAFQQPCQRMVAAVVQERELRLREYMRVLGMLDAAYWGSWFTTHIIILWVSGALCAFIGQVPFQSSSPQLMLLFYWVSSAALVAFSYATSTLFTSTRVASLFCPLIYLIAMVPAFLAVYSQTEGGASWYWACAFPPSAMTMFAMSLVAWELNGDGINSDTFHESLAPETDFSVSTIIWILAADFVLFWILTLLLDHMHSTGDGMPALLRHAAQWLSPRVYDRSRFGQGVLGGEHRSTSNRRLSTSYDSGSINNLDAPPGDDAASLQCDMTSDEESAGPFVPPDHVAIRMEGLTREFYSPGGSKKAVDGLSLDIFEGQVTALLGHNGAGKSTTMSMLTGMLAPTGGHAMIDGRDISRDMPAIRASLGVCPQFDILWPVLTVMEHLHIYAALRGIPKRQVPIVAWEAAQEVDLLEKLNTRAGELSGGQRRKLSVAIAFMGNPRIVFLDEPTSGMDPAARRFTWDVITRQKRRRAVVLTTHSMEEADTLCDRIVILSHGRLAAAGSALHLKEQYGLGYTLTVICQEKTEAVVTHESSTPTRPSWFTRPGAVGEGLLTATTDSACLSTVSEEEEDQPQESFYRAPVSHRIPMATVWPQTSAFEWAALQGSPTTASNLGTSSTNRDRTRRCGGAVAEGFDAARTNTGGSSASDVPVDTAPVETDRDDDRVSVAGSQASEALSFVSVSDRIAFFERSRGSGEAPPSPSLARTSSDHTQEHAAEARSAAQRATAVRMRKSMDESRSRSAPLLPLVRFEPPSTPRGSAGAAAQLAPGVMSGGRVAGGDTPRGAAPGATLPPRHAAMSPGAFGNELVHDNTMDMSNMQSAYSPIRTSHPLTAATLHAQHALGARVELDTSPAAPAAMRHWQQDEVISGNLDSSQAVRSPHALHMQSPRSRHASLPGSGTAADSAAMHMKQPLSPGKMSPKATFRTSVNGSSSDESAAVVGDFAMHAKRPQLNLLERPDASCKMRRTSTDAPPLDTCHHACASTSSRSGPRVSDSSAATQDTGHANPEYAQYEATQAVFHQSATPPGPTASGSALHSIGSHSDATLPSSSTPPVATGVTSTESDIALTGHIVPPATTASPAGSVGEFSPSVRGEDDVRLRNAYGRNSAEHVRQLADDVLVPHAISSIQAGETNLLEGSFNTDVSERFEQPDSSTTSSRFPVSFTSIQAGASNTGYPSDTGVVSSSMHTASAAVGGGDGAEGGSGELMTSGRRMVTPWMPGTSFKERPSLASDLPLHSGVHIAKTRSRTAASVVESSRREDAGDEHLRYSPSSGSLANVSTSAPVVSGETPEGTNGAGDADDDDAEAAELAASLAKEVSRGSRRSTALSDEPSDIFEDTFPSSAAAIPTTSSDSRIFGGHAPPMHDHNSRGFRSAGPSMTGVRGTQWRPARESSGESLTSTVRTRSTRSLRSGMHSFGMHTRGSADLDNLDSSSDLPPLPPLTVLGAPSSNHRPPSPPPQRLEPTPEESRESRESRESSSRPTNADSRRHARRESNSGSTPGVFERFEPLQPQRDDVMTSRSRRSSLRSSTNGTPGANAADAALGRGDNMPSVFAGLNATSHGTSANAFGPASHAVNVRSTATSTSSLPAFPRESPFSVATAAREDSQNLVEASMSPAERIAAAAAAAQELLRAHENNRAKRVSGSGTSGTRTPKVSTPHRGGASTSQGPGSRAEGASQSSTPHAVTQPSTPHASRPPTGGLQGGLQGGAQGQQEELQGGPGVVKAVLEEVPEASVLMHAADELVFRLPRDSVQTFPSMLRRLEAGKDQLGVRSFGLSVTTLEEVFLKIASEDPAAPGTSVDGSPRDPVLDSLPGSPAYQAPLQGGVSPHALAPPSHFNPLVDNLPQLPLSPALRLPMHERRRPRVADPLNCPRRKGFGRWGSQFRACVLKHVRTALREPWAAATQVAVPLVLVLSAALLGKDHIDTHALGPLPVDPMHTVSGWPGVVAATEEARTSPLFHPFVDGLGYDFMEWNDTKLDPAYLIFHTPDPHTLDGSLMEVWYSSSHIYSGVFVEKLPGYIPNAISEASNGKNVDDLSNSEWACMGDDADLSTSVRQQSQGISRDLLEFHQDDLIEPESCADAFKRELLQGLGWVSLRRYAACALSLGHKHENGDPAVHEMATLLQSMHNMHDAQPAHQDSSADSPCDNGDRNCLEDNMHGMQKEDRRHKHGKHACGRPPVVQFTLMVNETAKHAVPYALNSANNAALRALAGRGFMANATLSVTLEAFPVVPTEQWAVVSKQLRSGMLIMFCAFALSVLSASFVVIPVKERTSGSLHVQIVSGLSPSALWCGMLVTDVAIFCVPGVLILSALAWTDPSAFGWSHLPLMFVFMLAYALASISQMYAAHPLFADEMKAIVAMSTFLSTTGVIGRFVSIVFDALVHTGSESAVLKFWDKVIDWFLCLFSPTFQAMRVLSGEMTRSHDTTGINDWSFKNGDSAAVLWLLVQLVLNMAILLITTSGVVADMMHIAEQAIGKYLPSLNPSLKVLEDSEEPPVREESGEISRGPSRPVLFSQDMTGTFEADGSTANTPLLSPNRRKFASWASFGGFRGLMGLQNNRNNNGSQRATNSSTPNSPNTGAAFSPAAVSSNTPLNPHEGGSGASLPPALPVFSSFRRSTSNPTAAALREDVTAHSEVVQRANPEAYMVVLRKVAKVFTSGNWCRSTGSTVAVKDLSIAVHPQQCFGLLGTNGAGKTTTFRMLTNELRPTRGDVYLAGHRLSAALAPQRRSTGYCPQSGGLTNALSVQEVLEFYAAIRGLPEVDVDTAVSHALRTLGLREYRDVPVRALSGGNRRRLSVAAAMIGAPRVLLLDEPTTGMDPGARRGLWLALQAARQAGHTIVLTSHAMAEADVLCTRVGILVKGTMECVGAPMDLKARVCGGYVVEARLPRDQHTAFVSGLRETFSKASVRVAEQGPWSDIIVVTVSEEGLDVPRLFERAEELHTELHGSSYAVSQASLEHVFMHVAQLRGVHIEGVEDPEE